MSPYVFEQRAKSSAGFIFGIEKACLLSFLSRLNRHVCLLIKRSFCFDFSPKPLGLRRSMSVEMCAQIVSRQIIYLVTESFSDSSVRPFEIESAEFDAFCLV